MARYITFLRAINVGGHVVKMEALRAHFPSLGLSDVETFIASGNVIFQSASKNAQALEKRIAAHLHRELGYEVATFLRSDAELAAIARHQAFPVGDLAAESVGTYIGFLAAPLKPKARQKLMSQRSAFDDFHVHAREVYWLCRTKFSDSKFSGGLLEKILGVPATFRNANTVRKLAAKYPGCTNPVK